MIFIPILLLAIYLYAKGNKVPALFIMFFFITSGFNLIPEKMFDLGIGISKGSDLAFLTLLGCITLDTCFVKGFLRLDAFAKLLLVYFCFLFVCILYSKFSVGLSWSEVIRTSRAQFFWMAYFVFRNMDSEDIKKLLTFLFIVITFLSTLFVLQVILGETILLKGTQSFFKFSGYKFIRFYNQPDGLQFFTVMAIFCNPFRGMTRVTTAAILVAALLGAFHRSLISSLFIVLIIGYFIQLPYKAKVRTAIFSLFIIIPVLFFLREQISRSKIVTNIVAVMSGNFTDIEFEMEDLYESTFTFRLGHLIERMQYLTENPKTQLLGVGLIPEDSKKTDSMFNFMVGLVEGNAEQTTQIDSADISYSVLFIRFGYLGTFLFMLLIGFLAYSFYKNRADKYGLFSFLFLVLSFCVSFFSGNLLLPITFLLPLATYNIINKQRQKAEVVSDE